MRLKQYDLLKGIGILLVLIGHTHCSMPVFTGLYFFHMPLFFLVSGAFFKIKEGVSFAQYTRNRAKRLLRPYLVFLAVSLVFHLLSAVLWPEGGSVGASLKSKAILFGIGLVGNQESLAFRTLWFVICLFEVSVLCRAMAGIRNEWYRTGLSLLLFAAGYLLQVHKIDIPFFLDSALTLQFYFHLGHLFAHSGWSQFRFSPWVSLVCIVLIMAVFLQRPLFTDYRTNRFALVSIPLALLMVWNLYNLCCALAEGPLGDTRIVSLLNLMGLESLLVYGLHRNVYLVLDGLLTPLHLPSYWLGAINVITALALILMLREPLKRWLKL